MNKICVIAKNKETYFIKRLIEEVGEGVVLFDPWSDFMLPDAEKFITRTTGVYGNDLDLMIIKSLPAGKVFNSYDVLNKFRSKDVQFNWFEDNDFPHLPWISIKDTDQLNIEKFFRLYPECVVKPLRGQGGWGLEVLTWEKFKTWNKKKESDKSYLLQPFIKGATELRVFFIKGQSPIVLHREAKSGIAANFKKQGSARLSQLPVQFEEKIMSLIQNSGASYGAIDLFIDDNRLYILELNTVPGIEQIEGVSGQNIMKLLIEAF